MFKPKIDLKDQERENSSKSEGIQAPDTQTMLYDLKGLSAMFWFVATSDDLKGNGGADFFHWLSQYLSEFHDKLTVALDREYPKTGVPRG